MKLAFVCLLSILVSVSGQASLLKKLKLVEPEAYYEQLLQETLYEVERKGWWNLHLADFTQELDEITHTNLVVKGLVKYANGFVVSIQKVDLSNVIPFDLSSVINNVTVTTVGVKGDVNFRHLNVGYDVIANVTNDNKLRRYTGIFTHSLIQCRFEVAKNMNTNVISTFVSVKDVSGGSGVRMVYMPSDEISEILSLRFLARSTRDSAEKWMKEEFQPIMLKLAQNEIPFPNVCFNC